MHEKSLFPPTRTQSTIIAVQIQALHHITSSQQAPHRHIISMSLQEKFTEFASYGSGGKTMCEMESKNFYKLFKDCGLIDKAFTQTDCDLIFTKVKTKGARKIVYGEFVTGLDHVAAKKKSTADDIAAAICGSGGAKTNATVADYVKYHDDKSLYSGVYANGGPTNVDTINCMAAGNLAIQMDRSSADNRGVKHTHQ